MIMIKAIGYQFGNPGGMDMKRMEGSGDYLFIYFRCSAEVLVEGIYKKIPKNTFLLYKKGEPQIYRKTDGDFINDWVHFDFDDYNDYFEKLEIPFNVPVILPESKVITDMIGDLFIEFFNVGDQHEYIMDKKASVLFHKFSDLYKMSIHGNTAMNKYMKPLLEIRKKIHNFEYIPDGADEVAEELNISTSYLQHMYKEFFGMSLNQDIIKGRVEHASRLLHGTDASVSEIGRICGYENLEHFSRQFKKCKGCSPKQFRG